MHCVSCVTLFNVCDLNICHAGIVLCTVEVKLCHCVYLLIIFTIYGLNNPGKLLQRYHEVLASWMDIYFLFFLFIYLVFSWMD